MRARFAALAKAGPIPEWPVTELERWARELLKLAVRACLFFPESSR